MLPGQNPPMPPEQERVALRSAIKGMLFEILSRLSDRAPMRVRVRDQLGQVTLVISPSGSESSSTLGVGGLFFSPIEAAIVHAIGETNTIAMMAKRISSRCGQKYTGTFRAILNNLVDRHILDRGTDGQGYLWSEDYRRAQKKCAS